MIRRTRLAGCALLTALALAGCDGGSGTPSKKEFDDKDKQHLNDLNKQRGDEWSSTKAKQKP